MSASHNELSQVYSQSQANDQKAASDRMFYLSTRGDGGALSFEEVLLRGLAPDGGLYLPSRWPTVSRQQLRSWRDCTYRELAFQILSRFVSPEEEIRSSLSGIVDDAYSNLKFPSDVANVRQLNNWCSLLELYHGPTFAFKDVALQFLAPAMDVLLDRGGRWATIVGATSGDTGSAAIEAYKGRDHVNIFILYPDERISEIQRRQMTTVSESNVFPIPVLGTFDDCQAILKELFQDNEFRQSIHMTAVNSINWARIAAQVVYYFYGYFKMIGNEDDLLDVCVPTGNFGNIFAAYIAKQMGLPLRRLIIASNENDILPRAINTGIYEVKGVTQTRAPSMDIQISSNFERLIYCCSGRDSNYVNQLMQEFRRDRKVKLKPTVLDEIKRHFSAYSVPNWKIDQVIGDLDRDMDVLVDPHTACGYAALEMLREESSADNVPVMLVATAHPAKFATEIMEHVGIEVTLPERLKRVLHRKERDLDRLGHNTREVKEYILRNVKRRVSRAA